MDPKTLVALLAQGALFLLMASFGMKTSANEMLATMRDTGLISRGILAVYVLVPAVAVTACLFLPIEQSVRIGIVIMAISPLAPVLPIKMRHGHFTISQAVGLYVALILAGVVLVPLTVGALSALFPANASLSVSAMARLVVTTVLLPISIGFALANFAPAFARQGGRIASIIGLAALGLLVVLVLYVQGREVLSLVGDGSLLAIALTVTAGIIAGHVFGRPDPARSNALAMAAAVRHPGIAALIVHSNFSNPRVMLAVVLFLITSVVVTAIYQRWLRSQFAGSKRSQAAA